MGKSARKKKEKKADFQKVKFKVGKKIKKGNAVDTTFKTTKIVIREQLKATLDEKEDLSGKARRDIKEILTRVQHYNSSMRCDALNALKETLKECPNQIDIYLGQIVGRSMEVCIDGNESVRKAAYNLLQHVFANVSAANMVPFFPTIVALLRCAMTHITHDIQLSSLLIIDLLVDFYPSHLAHFSKQLLPDFLSQISDEKRSGMRNDLGANLAGASVRSSGVMMKIKKKMKDLKTNTTKLTSDPSRNVTSVVWHLHVAKRLRKILYHIWVCITKKDDDRKEDQGLDFPENVVTWQADKPLYVSLHYKCFAASDTTDSTNRQQLVDFFDSACQLKSLFSSLTRLLCEMWVEASSLDVKIGKNAVTSRSLEIYGCIVDIIRLMWKLVQHWQKEEKELQGDFFDGDFVKNFGTYCMSGFPYTDCASYSGRKHRQKRKLTTFGGHSVFSLNLLLCDIVMCLRPSMKKTNNSIELSWLLNVLKDWETWSPHEAETMVNVIRRFLSYKNSKTKDLLGAVHNLYKQLPLEHPTRNLLLNLVCDVLTLPSMMHIQRIDTLWIWISSLPEDVTKYDAKIPFAMLKIFQCVVCQGRKGFLSNLEKHFPDMLELLHRLNNEDFKAIANFLYWIPHMNHELFKAISLVCLNPNLDIKKCAYIVHLMNNRFQKEYNLRGNENSALYLSFLFSVCFGCSRVELQHLNSDSFQNGTRKGFVSRIQEQYKILLNKPDELEHQKEVTNVAVTVLNLVPLELELRSMAEGFLKSILMEYYILPLSCIQSIFLLVTSIWNNSQICESLHSPLCNLFLSLVEISVGKDEDIYRNLLVVARKALIVPGFSMAVSSALFDVTTQSLNDEFTCNIIGEILNQMTKSTKHLNHKSNESLRSVLKELEKANLTDVSTSRWYISSRYELGLCSEVEDHIS